MSETIALTANSIPTTIRYNGSFTGTYTAGQTPDFETASVPEGKVWAVNLHIHITEKNA